MIVARANAAFDIGLLFDSDIGDARVYEVDPREEIVSRLDEVRS